MSTMYPKHHRRSF